MVAVACTVWTGGQGQVERHILFPLTHAVTAAARRARQEAITAEIIEIAAGGIAGR